MTFSQFKAVAMTYTREQLRCDVPPPEGVYRLMGQCGLDAYELYVTRLLREADGNLQRMAFAEEYR